MQRIGVALLAVLTAMMPIRALAWGYEAHRIIAHLAYERLTPKARAAVDGLLAHAADQGTPTCPAHTLEEASAWPDCVRGLHGRFDYLTPDHFEDIPNCGAAVRTVTCPGDQCLTAEISRAFAVLRDRRRGPVERLQALEEVTHFVGDLHQPLHVADNDDRGGNQVRVEVDGYPSNLHHVWDDVVVTAAVGEDEAAAERMLRPLIAANATAWAAGDLATWRADAHALAVSYVYGRLDQPPGCGHPAARQAITQAYLTNAAPMVRVQLGKAAVRVAATLNGALGR